MGETGKSEYVAGTCNLGSAETRHRLMGGWIGVALTAALAAGFWKAGSEPEMRLFLFFPTFFGALGFLQARQKFCVAYGLAGNRNVGEEIGKSEPVEALHDRQKDRRRSLKVIAQALAIGAAIAFIAFAL